MRRSILTLGTFDGVHSGHRALFAKVMARAKARRARRVVLAFGMPPRHTRPSGSDPEVLLTTLSEKIDILHSLGIQDVEILQFNRRLASTAAETFFQRRLRERWGMVEMVVGPRVAFGKDRQGRLPWLRRACRAAGVALHVVTAVGHGARSISSRRIRALLRRGNVEEARRALGYPYSAEGTVVHGDRRGRRLGYPTANLAVDPSKILPPGVFWVKVVSGSLRVPLDNRVLRKAVDGLCNVGTRPTFSNADHSMHCEVFLLNKTRRLYGRRLRVVFLKKIRSEKKFHSVEALRRQIGKDLNLARSWIARQ